MPDGVMSYGTPDIFSDTQADMLRDNLDPTTVKSRLQGGVKVSYIEGYHAIKEANRIFGFGAWTRELLRLEETNRDLVEVQKDGRGGKYTAKQWRVGYIATVRITVYGDGGARYRDGTGFGSGFGSDNQLGDAIESAVKEAETDAMKRALITFGNPFGLALYDKDKREVGPSVSRDDDDNEAPVGPPQKQSNFAKKQNTATDGQKLHDWVISQLPRAKNVDRLDDWHDKHAARINALRETEKHWFMKIMERVSARRAELLEMSEPEFEDDR